MLIYMDSSSADFYYQSYIYFISI